MLHVSSIGIVFALIQRGFGHPKPQPNRIQLPVVDLGYERHQAISYNTTSEVYEFSNIRYAQPPIGQLRFQAPVAPKTDRQSIQNGSEIRTCAQGVPVWQARAFGPIGEFTNGTPFTLAAWETAIANATAPSADIFNQNVTEDCLFLDIHVPRQVFEKTKADAVEDEGAPVIVWVHGGGYVLGSKKGVTTPGYVPSGLIQHSQENNRDGVIFVAINYRLGAFGWSAGPEVEKVQENIHLFGGSAKRVTVIGESAGGASLMLHTVAFGGGNGASTPFSQVIAQSLGIVPTTAQPETALKDFLSLLNVTTLAEARNLSSEALIQANAKQIEAAPWSSYIYGPVVDGDIVPESPAKLLASGKFDKSVKMLTGHNSFEGGFFLDPAVESEASFKEWLQSAIANLSSSHVDYLAEQLYPPTFDGSLGYTDQASRQIALFGEAVFDCNALSLNEGFGSQSYAYEFSVTPGVHTQDLDYTFNNPAAPAFYPKAQEVLQRLIIDFAIDGVPRVQVNGSAQASPRWDASGELISITANGVDLATSSTNRTRCAWWQAI